MPGTETKYYEDEENYDEEPSPSFSENARKGLSTAGKVLMTVGSVLLKILKAIGSGVLFVIVHCKYFCINLYREIKRSNAKRKRRKEIEERRRRESERRRIERDATRERRELNASRGENDLVKVHSSRERRPSKPDDHITVEINRPGRKS